MGRVLVQQPGTNTAKALSETLPKNVIIVDEDLKELRLHDGVTPGGKIIGQNTGSGIPVGTIIPFAGNSVPQGYLLCDGSAISRTDYASLFAVIGTIYGAGDGNATFNLPNTNNRVLWGNGNGYLAEQLPNIRGNFPTVPSRSGQTISGAFYVDGTNGSIGYQNYTVNFMNMVFNASRSSSTYTDNGIVRPNSLQVRFCIKY